jgi:serine acetyltransferase
MEIDVRFDEIGLVNRIINWTFSGWKPKIIRRIISFIFHIELPVIIHPLRLPHPYGVMIAGQAKLGRNVTVFQGVTIGSKRLGRNAGCPIIGDNVVVFPNAVIVGSVVIGEGATIGPGAVIVNDVLPNQTVVTAPVKVINNSND